MSEPKPTIDERLEALKQRQALHRANLEADRLRGLEMDARERKGRAALLVGIAAYLRAMNGEA